MSDSRSVHFEGGAPTGVLVEPATARPRGSDGLVAVGLLMAVAVALSLRLPGLSYRPMHGDEAVHAVKFAQLWESRRYRYDPNEFHGPTLYYATWPVMWLSGARDLGDTTETTFRLVPVLLGTLSILLLWLLRDGLGALATLLAAMLLAISPALVFYSRYYIHETLLVSFSLGAVACGWRYARGQRLGWAVLTGVCLGLMFATKETAVFVYAAMAGGVAVMLSRRSPDGSAGSRRWRGRRLHLLVAAVAAIIVSALLYSSFFSNARGILDCLRTFGPWAGRVSDNTPHLHPWYYYLSLLAYTHDAPGPVWSEALILALAAIGGVSVVAGIRRAAGTADAEVSVPLRGFLLVYTAVLTCIYCFVPYKTPWNVTGFLTGMVLLAGIGGAAIVRAVRPISLRIAVMVVLLAGAGQLAVQAQRTALRFSADQQRNPYVYAQPVRDVADWGRRVEQIAHLHPRGRAMLVRVVASPWDTWPLPWYLRRLSSVGYYTEPPEPADAPVLIVSAEMQAATDARLHGLYQRMSFGLRPGVMMVAYIRDDLWGRFVQSRATGPAGGVGGERR